MTRARDIADQQDNLGGAVAPFVAGKNLVINGGFDIWQRGTSSSSTGYLADRWFNGGSNTTYARETTAANLPAGFRYGIKMTTTATDTPYSITPIETMNAIAFAGKRVVLSYYAATSNSTDVTVRLDASTSVDVGPTGSFTQLSPAVGTSNQPTTTSMTRVSVVYDVPSTTLSLRIIIGSNASLVSGRTVTITGVQLELGSQATPFARAGGSIGGELALCQRYYYRITSGIAFAMLIPNGVSTSSTLFEGFLTYPVTMRIAPNVLEFSTLYVAQRTTTSSDQVIIAGTLGSVTPNTGTLVFTVASGLTTNASGTVRSNNSSTAYFALSSEL
jgi:hypothetical protein